MNRHTFPRAALALALLLALCLPAGLAATELTATFKDGRMSWNAIDGADTYYYRVYEEGVESVSTTALSADIDAYLDGLIEAGAIQNTGAHEIYLEAYNSETFDTVVWMGTYRHVHPTLPTVGDVVYKTLADSAAYDAATGVLSWAQRSSLTSSYFYAVAGVSQLADGLSVNLHAAIDALVTEETVPYAQSFKIELTACNATGDALETWSKSIDYTPNITLIDVHDDTTIVGGVQDAYDWTGKAIRPAVTYVSVKGKVLTAGTDYAVSYGANTDAGAGTVIIEGKGRYTGSVTVGFTITPPPPEPIDAAIDAAGTLSWAAYPGALSYSVGVDGLFISTTALSADLNGLIDTMFCNGDIASKEGYAIALEAFDANGVLLQSWSGEHSHVPVLPSQAPSDPTEAPAASTEAPAVAVSLAAADVTVKDQAYTGKALEPPVTVTLDGAKLVEGTDYEIAYENNREVGTATVTVTGVGGYEGTATGTFRINPKKVSGVKLKAGSKKLTVSWKKVGGVTGYQVQYAAKKTFKGAKTVTVKGAKTLKTTLKKLKAGTTYYVRVRSYKKVGGVKYTSAWSGRKGKKTWK